MHGIGPSGAARLVGDIADVSRFTSRGHFASWNGTAPIDASSGDQNRHRLSRARNRRIKTPPAAIAFCGSPGTRTAPHCPCSPSPSPTAASPRSPL
nr:transposase [Catenuloplanes nepalensis]